MIVVVTCAQCRWEQYWPSKEEADAAMHWHTYEAHLWLWRMRPNGDSPPSELQPTGVPRNANDPPEGSQP
jgi:hypothetical protein